MDVVSARLARARRTFKVARRITALNLRARMAYRADFVVQILFGIVWQTSTLIFASVLLTRFSGLGNFPGTGVLLIIGMRLLSHGLHVLFFENIAFLPMLVDQGRMDGFFIRPLPVLTQLLLSDFSVNSLGDIAVGVTTFGFAVALVHIHWTVAKALYAAAAIVGGALVEGSLQTVLACLLLHSPGSRMLGSWVDELMSTFGNYPLSILPRAVQTLFTFVLPIAFVAYFPVEVLLGLAPGHGAMSMLVHWSPAAGFVLFWLARKVWSWSLRHYRTSGG